MVITRHQDSRQRRAREEPRGHGEHYPADAFHGLARRLYQHRLCNRHAAGECTSNQPADH